MRRVKNGLIQIREAVRKRVSRAGQVGLQSEHAGPLSHRLSTLTLFVTKGQQHLTHLKINSAEVEKEQSNKRHFGNQ